MLSLWSHDLAHYLPSVWWNHKNIYYMFHAVNCLRVCLFLILAESKLFISAGWMFKIWSLSRAKNRNLVMFCGDDSLPSTVTIMTCLAARTNQPSALRQSGARSLNLWATRKNAERVKQVLIMRNTNVTENRCTNEESILHNVCVSYSHRYSFLHYNCGRTLLEVLFTLFHDTAAQKLRPTTLFWAHSYIS